MYKFFQKILFFFLSLPARVMQAFEVPLSPESMSDRPCGP